MFHPPLLQSRCRMRWRFLIHDLSLMKKFSNACLTRWSNVWSLFLLFRATSYFYPYRRPTPSPLAPTRTRAGARVLRPNPLAPRAPRVPKWTASFPRSPPPRRRPLRPRPALPIFRTRCRPSQPCVRRPCAAARHTRLTFPRMRTHTRSIQAARPRMPTVRAGSINRTMKSRWRMRSPRMRLSPRSVTIPAVQEGHHPLPMAAMAPIPRATFSTCSMCMPPSIRRRRTPALAPMRPRRVTAAARRA